MENHAVPPTILLYCKNFQEGTETSSVIIENLNKLFWNSANYASTNVSNEYLDEYEFRFEWIFDLGIFYP